MKPIKKRIRKVPYYPYQNKGVSTSFALFMFFLNILFVD